MSVILETSLGDIVIDLFTEECPKSTRNFLKLCKIKYYNNVIFHSIDKDFIAQSGDQSGTGKGGSSIYGQLYGPQSRLFSHEIVSGLNHAKKGTVGYVPGSTELDVPSNGSVFYITMRDGLDYLDGKNTIFGIVAEGFDVLEKLNGAFVDEGSKKPLKNIKIRHTVVLDDPFDDPAGLEVQDLSPEVEFDPLDVDYEEPEEAEFDEEKKIEILKEKEAVGRAQVLEIVRLFVIDFKFNGFRLVIFQMQILNLLKMFYLFAN
jgi:peptidyl-prolyl cis-trans isomerase-like 4